MNNPENKLFDLKVYRCLCSCEKFQVNGIDADSNDFGDQTDIDEVHAEEYCCGNMHFTPYPPKQEILDKYHINEDEYWQIAHELEDKLSFGECGLCS